MNAARALVARLCVAAALLSSMVFATASPLAHNAVRAARPSAGTKDLVAYVLQNPFSLPAGYTPNLGGMAVDTAGDLYVMVAAQGESTYGAYVVVFDPRGHELRRWPIEYTGGVTRTPIAIGPDGLLYVAAPSVQSLSIVGPGRRIDDQIAVFTPDGHFLKVLGPESRNTPIGTAANGDPVDIKLDSKGNIYVATQYSIVRLDPAGNVTAVWSPFGSLAGKCPGGSIGGLALAPDDTVWFSANCPTPGVFHLDADGKLLHDAPNVHVVYPQGSTFAGLAVVAGRVYVTAVTNLGTEGVFVYSLQGQVLGLFGGAHDGYAPIRRVVVSGNNVYFAPYTSLATRQPLRERDKPQERAGAPPGSGIGTAAASPSTVPPRGQENQVDLSACNPPPYTGQDSDGQPEMIFGHPPGSSCAIGIIERWQPHCPGTPLNVVKFGPGNSIWAPHDIVMGGQRDNIFTVDEVQTPQGPATRIRMRGQYFRQGDIYAEYLCRLEVGGERRTVALYELKGYFDLRDPSGTVVDRRTGRPLAGAPVRLQFSPTKGGRFGSPPLGGYSPQISSEVTATDGRFAWMVADGYWRLVASLFGYHSLTSKVYKVPPPVTGIVLALRRDPRQQALLIDPTGRVGPVRLGARLARGGAPSGLRVVVSRRRVRTIAVLSTGYRTARGIGLGSGAVDLIAAYPSVVKPIKGKVTPRPQTVVRVTVSHATFTLKKQKVVGITLR